MAELLVLGIGNPDRGDDGVGRAVARALRELAPAGATIDECGGEVTAILARLEVARRAILIDACVAGDAPGGVRRFDVKAAPLPSAAFGFSSHGLGLHEAIELARTLGALPDECVVYAVQGAGFAAGAPLSPPVAAAAAELARRLADEIAGQAQEGVHA